MILPGVEVYVGDWKALIPAIADAGYRNRVMTAVTSPPYKGDTSGLRRYLPVGHPLAHLEVGTEASVDQFVTGLCDGFDLYAEHLMHPAGSLWVNLGDAYAGSGGPGRDYNPGGLREGQPRAERQGKRERWPAKSLLLVPERFVLEMARRGWVVRNKPIWYKGKGVDDYLDDEDEGMPGSNSMPSSAPNRLKNTYEHWYHFTRSNRPIWWYHRRTCQIVSRRPRQEYEPVLDEQGNPVLTRSGKPKMRPLWVSMDYFYDLDAIREPHTSIGRQPIAMPRHSHKWGEVGNGHSGVGATTMGAFHPLGRNPGDLWPVATSPFPLAHFACYPVGVTRIPILSTCPEAVCRQCGAPRMAVYDVHSKPAAGRDQRQVLVPGNREQQSGNFWQPPDVHFVGYTDCGCGAGWTGGIVLDPFFGSGTTAQGAMTYRPPRMIDGYLCQPTVIGIDLDRRNLTIIEQRLTGRARPSRRVDKSKYGGDLFEREVHHAD